MNLRAFILANALLTDAQIVAALPPVTFRPVALRTLAPYLRKLGIMAALQATAANPDAPLAVRVGVGGFLDHLADPRQEFLDSTDPVIAAQVAQIVAALQAAGRMTPDQAADVYAMGGGLAFADVDEARVAGQRAAMAREAEIDALWALAVAAVGEAQALHQLRNSRVADLRNDPALAVPATLAELDGAA